MLNFIKRIPIPIAGVALALSSLANLLANLNPIILALFRITSAVIIALLTLKVIIFRKTVLEDFKNPVILSVSPTYSMTLMLLGAYLKTLGQNKLAIIIWFLGIIIHLIFIVIYTIRFIIKFDIKNIFPSVFIVYVGIGTIGITAPAFKMLNLGQASFWFAFLSLLVLLPIVIYRLLKIKSIPESLSPTFTILAAPASLSLVAYLKSFLDKNLYIVALLTILSMILYVVAIIAMMRLLRLKFYPSFSAFTFPMVISGMAINGTYTFLLNFGYDFAFLKYIVVSQKVVAIIIVIYVLLRYIIFLFRPLPRAQKTSK